MKFPTTGVIALLILLTFRPVIADSPPEAVPETTLAPIEVTATRLADVREDAAKIPVKVVVITAEDIERLGARTVQEVLQYQSGIVMYDSIGNEFEQTVDLRGFNGQPTPGITVFQDGVRINEPGLQLRQLRSAAGGRHREDRDHPRPRHRLRQQRPGRRHQHHDPEERGRHRPVFG